MLPGGTGVPIHVAARLTKKTDDSLRAVWLVKADVANR
jgi:hypothetical protein